MADQKPFVSAMLVMKLNQGPVTLVAYWATYSSPGTPSKVRVLECVPKGPASKESNGLVPGFSELDTLISNVRDTVRLGVPLSVTSTVMLAVVGTVARLGIQAITPLGSMRASGGELVRA